MSRLRSLTSALVLGLAATAAQAFPEKTITLIMPFAAGGSVDVIARDFAQSLAAVTKQSVIVDNKLGAEGIIAGQALVGATPDGHTLMFTSSSLPVLDPLLKKNLPYDPVRDFIPVCSVGSIGNVLSVSASRPYKSAAELVAAAKASPGKLTYAYTSTTTRLAAELFQQATDTKLTGIPYKSSPGALTDVAGGQVDMVFIDPVVTAPFVQGNRVRPLVVAGPQRIRAMPDVPSATEAGVPGYNVKPWFALFAPPKTPPAVLARVRDSVAQALRTSTSKADLEKRGVDAHMVCGDELAKMRSDEIAFWRGVIKKAGIEPQ